MKTLIFGNGYSGNAYRESGLFPGAVISCADITDNEAVVSVVRKYQPDVIINCAGKTNLEWCRDRKDEAMRINGTAPLDILRSARAVGAFFVQLGSGCIFEGEGKDGRGFTEEDIPNPQCYYAETKVHADELLMNERYEKALILRLRQPFSSRVNHRNLITKVLSYDKLITSQNSMTSMDDLVRATRFLIEKGEQGIFNVTNTGTISPYEIAILVKEMLGIEKQYIPITKDELDAMDLAGGREKRVDTILNITKLARAGFQMSDVRVSMVQSLKQYEA